MSVGATPPRPRLPGARRRLPGGQLFVRAAGGRDGEPALFVHGLGGASTNWTDLMTLLADRLSGEALDLPGFGESDPPSDGRYSLDFHARAVAELAATRGQPVHLFGNSLGGAIALRVAAERPELVRSLTLVSPALPSYRPDRTDPLLPLLLVPGITGIVLAATRRESPERRARRVLELCYGDPLGVHPERIAQAADDIRRRRELAWNDDALVASLRGLVRAQLDPGPRNLWRQAARVTAPTLLIWGKRDRVVPVRLAERAAKALRARRLLVLDGVGHVAQMEQPDAVAAAVRDLLDEVVGKYPGAARPGDTARH
ncbi:MAG: alpha/beta fold hydrolase [Mycobacteriales bacterium]|nr:alpha/beta fold hydrolase [Frankia sp.]